MYLHTKQITTSGKAVDQARQAIVMLHGRGASARDIVALKGYLKIDDMAIFAPEATNHSWYPFSFMAPVEQNQPALDSALKLIGEVVEEIKASGITPENIFFAGFSQGACLTLEYTARHAQRYGGIIAFTGGLVGEQLVENNYQGDFGGTPVFISTGNPDPHVPVSRVNESIGIFKQLNAVVTSEIYTGRPHTISADEIEKVNEQIFS